MSAGIALNGRLSTDEEDDILGLGGSDDLREAGGDDTIFGGRGHDMLRGGGGADTFVFNAKLGGKNVDSITDFTHGIDVIALDDAVFGGVGAKLTKSEFYAKAGATAGHDGNDRVIYDTKSGKLFYDTDGKGGDDAVQFAVLSGHPALAHGDFVIV